MQKAMFALTISPPSEEGGGPRRDRGGGREDFLFIKGVFEHRHFYVFHKKREQTERASAKEAVADTHSVCVDARDDLFSSSFQPADDLFSRFFCRGSKFVDQG